MDIINHFLFGEIVDILRYFDQFRFNTLQVFNLLFFTHLYSLSFTNLQHYLTFFMHDQSLRAVNSLYESLCSSTTLNFSFAQPVFPCF